MEIFAFIEPGTKLALPPDILSWRVKLAITH